MNSKTKKRNLVLVVAIALIAITTIAYAALSQQLTITGEGTLKGSEWDIRFNNVECADFTGDVAPGSSSEIGTNSAGNYCTKIEITGVELNLPGDSVTYTFDIVNGGSIDAKISSITAAPLSFTPASGADKDIAAANVSWTLTKADGVTPLEVGDALGSGDSLDGNMLVIKFADNASAIPANDVSINGSWEINYVQD